MSVNHSNSTLKKTRNGATLKPTERLAVSDVFSVKVLSSQVCALMKVFLFLLSKAKYLIFKNVFSLKWIFLPLFGLVCSSSWPT